MSQKLVNIPQFEFKVHGTRELKSFFALANMLTEELTIHVIKNDPSNREGLVFRSTDPKNISMLDVMWDSTNFEKWNVIKEGAFGIKTAQVRKIVRHFDKKDNVTISIKDEMLTFETPTSKEQVALIEPDQFSVFDMKIPHVKHNATITLEHKQVKNIVKRIAQVSEYLRINMHEQKIEFSGKGATGEANIMLEKGMPYIPEFYLTENSASNYPIEYVEEFLKCLDGSMLILNFSNQMPIKIFAPLGINSRIDYWIATRIVEGTY